MFSNQEHNYRKRLFIISLIVWLSLGVIVVSLINKSIISHKYYDSLSKSNRVREEKVIAPRGIFIDRAGKALAENQSSQKFGFRRVYLYPKLTGHLLGYLSLPDTVNLQDYSCGAPALPNQFVGKVGLEKYYECLLRGKPGKIIYETNALGKKTRELARSEPKSGENIYLTIDLSLQIQADKAMKGRPGAIIATNPKTGEVLLFYSSPGFNSNQLTKEAGLYERLSLDEGKPLLNRLTLGLYPPGSVIKPILALAGLEEGVINKNTEYTDKGVYKLGGLEFGNWYFLQYGKTEGQVDVVKGIKRSNDIFFYHLGVEMGVNKINSWLKKFDLDKQEVKEYFPQAKGLLPNNNWKKKTLGEEWYLGDTVNLSIGQGYLLLNPLQLHTALSAIANNGRKCNLVFVKNGLRHCKSLDLNQEHLETVIDGMIQTCQSGGTGWPFFDFKVNQKSITVACKTGTAESTSDKALPHAWFTVFAPAYDPEIILTVLVENGGEGSAEAAPIAKQILSQYFSTD